LKIIFVTSNKSKFDWAKRRLKKYSIELIQKELEIEEIREPDVEKVASDKAKSASNYIKDPFIMEDTGFYVKALNGFPSTYVKFAMGTLGTKGLLKLLEGEKNRKAIFKSALVFREKNKEHLFLCEDKGTMSYTAKGTNSKGFNDLFTIFIPEGFTKTLAEMNKKEFLKYEKGIENHDHYCKFGNWLAKRQI
jgi:XTP/dITP diphosphohydrolase